MSLPRLLRPEDVGLGSGTRRRTPGLRREEVAALAGMSADYYTRLEQQRGPQPSEQMIAALRFVVSGGIYLPPEALPGTSASPPSAEASRFQLLSPRQLQVARLLLQGQANKAIARALEVSEGTVKAHVSAIYQIIGARNRVEAVTLAARQGFIAM